ncbi:translation initiation factor IF-3 [Kocuria rhizophila]|uniref:translation initiation factor IF-3 n=1 Tax=Kocuria TaxID=57493 RepID=UPI001CD4A37E|nr:MULTISPECIES: translation initiation factor IF-3 [Kocuria]WIW68273.1 translation initiation factor IF-3 [Kocuria sp. ChxB]MCR4526893.1 translation initiation factor IF-3 [Kocuria rhizophila]MCT1546161.1 translation initiation factor IF-3 [Kocuria rhizophila]MCT2171727.1 translation initiation factor IF-3 [Kocuria rhizophila]MDA4829153.1 translation initiation factor IF-3 [Kocuria rhizophila]
MPQRRFCRCGGSPAHGVTHETQEIGISDPRINDRIRVPEVRLVGPGGEQVGIVRVQDALRLARESDLDLVEVAPNAKPPVAKLMDFGKYKYEAAVKARESRKNQANTVLKEVRFRLKIDTHDYETKVGHAKRFLSAGDKVKAMIQFRGREQQRPEMGVRLLERLANDVAEVGAVETNPRVDGRNMVMVIGPLKNKAEARAEARKQQQRENSKAENQRKQRVDTSSPETVTQSIGDAFPEELRNAASAPAEDQTVESAPLAPEDEVKATVAPATETTETTVDPTAPAVEPAEPKAAPAKSAAKPASKPAAAKPAAAKPAASPAKPGAPKPGAPKPGAGKPGPAKK